MPDNSQFCPNCGNANKYYKAGNNDGVRDFTNQVNNAFNRAEQSLGNEVHDIHQTFQNAGSPYGGTPLKTDRGLAVYIVLTIITCGIYGYYFIYKMAADVNVACEGDGERTSGLVAFILLSIITCGIYAWFWYYNLGNRLAANAPKYGMNFQENGTTVLMWCLFGSLLCGIGPFIAMNILIKNTNKICAGYNRAHGLN